MSIDKIETIQLMVEEFTESLLDELKVMKKSLQEGMEPRVKVSIIFNESTHRGLKAAAAMDGRTISDVMEELAYGYLKERGKI